MPTADPPSPASKPSKPFSMSLGFSKAKSAHVSNPKKRPHSALADPESDHEEDVGPQKVTGFDQSIGGAIGHSTTPTKSPLIIRAEKNRDWRQESRRKRGKNLLPAEVQARKNGLSNGNPTATEVDEISKEAGLTFIKQEDNKITPACIAHTLESTELQIVEKKRTADEEAMEALLGAKKESMLVLPSLEATYQNGTSNGTDASDEFANEDDRFKADVASRPDVATLDEYAAVPVEEFGAALLRGMGWKEGDAVGQRRNQPSKNRVVERRPALLGIGAKETPGGVGDELGAWGEVAKGKRKTDLAYNPVMLKNAKTGEILTEEELEMKKLEGKKNADDTDWRQRRDRNLAIDQGKKSERERLRIEDGRRKDRSRSSDKSHAEKARHGSSRRHRSRSGERSRHSSSRRERSRSHDRSKHGSSQRARSRSMERKHGRRDYDGYDRRDRDSRRR